MKSIATSTWSLALITGAALIAASACSAGGPGDDGGSGGKPDEIGCPDDLQFFQQQVFQPILGQECIVCHSAGGLAEKSHMVLSKELSAMESNFEIVREVARMDVDGTSVLLLRPTGKHPEGHTGGTLIDYGTPEYAALSTFVDRVTRGVCDGSLTPASCEGPARGGRLLRRLSRSEYDATVTSLLNIPSEWGAAFGADTVVEGFDNNASALVVSPLLADQIRTAAEEITAAAFQDPAAVLPCDPAAGESACADQLIDSFGKRAFRRPLDDADRARYKALYNAVAAEDGFTEGAKSVVTAMLQSPHFLYRSELGGAAKDGVVTLTPHEIASELSYLFWGTMPDTELFAAAESGALASAAEIAKQAERLLADKRSDAVLDRFVDQWLLVGNVVNVPKDNNVYPGFTPEIRAAMRDEVRAMFRAVVRGETPTLPALLGADHTRVAPALADLYGASGTPGADGLVDIDLAGSERIGILTAGGVLATHAHPTDSSPIHRGKLVRTRVLCGALPPPPAGFNVQPPPLDPELTTRERYIAHSSEEPCKSCHTLIDPIGFGFERFDGIGRFRETENGKPIDVAGEITSTAASNGEFDGTTGLVEKLSKSPDTAACFSLQWLRYAYALDDSPNTQCLARDLADGFTAGGQRIDTLLYALVKTAHFTQRVADPGIGDTPDPGTGGAGGEGGSGTGGSGQGGSGGGAPVTDDLGVTVTQDSTWATGSCSSVKVENKANSPVTWSISLDIGGTLTDVWNAQSTPDGAKTKFTGVDYNATLNPGEIASFGYCISL